MQAWRLDQPLTDVHPVHPRPCSSQEEFNFEEALKKFNKEALEREAEGEHVSLVGGALGRRAGASFLSVQRAAWCACPPNPHPTPPGLQRCMPRQQWAVVEPGLLMDSQAGP